MMNLEAPLEVVSYLDMPDKSENDKKLYKTVVLTNGLRALLISDPSPVPHDGLTSSSNDSSGDSYAEESRSDADVDESMDSTTEEDDSDSDDDSEEGDEKLAACAVLIDVGSFTEPSNFQGLAHFLEHMIFMGSEKYPAENAFDMHIKKSGGFENANTECEETVYYFEVAEEHLDSSMDYFTALLKAPLMKKEAMTRERDAIESEFQEALLDDEARRDQLLASLATVNYPHNTFAWGNQKSLKENVDDNELHRALHEFRERHYSAHRMVVCVQARLPIDELETLVEKHFSGIPSNNLPGRNFADFDYRAAFREEFHSEVLFVKPVEKVCKLELTWVLPSSTKLYKCKPYEFLSYLVDYEGEGSLCAYLRKRLWGLEVITGTGDAGFDVNSIYSLFYLSVFLTDSGFEHLDQVLAAIFAYIKLLSLCGSLKDVYAELQQIEATSFRFDTQKPAFNNVKNLVLQMKYYSPKDILTGKALYFEYNEDQVQDVIRHLNEFKFNIMITSQQTYENITYDKKEPWFGTEYMNIPMPQKWRELWERSQPMAELFLPKRNQFLSNDFRLLWNENGKPELPSVPKKILQTDICELWFRQDDKFNLPEAVMYFNFISPLLRKTPKNDIMCALYVQLVNFRLCEELYPATVAGLNYQLNVAEKSVFLKIHGYNEKLHLLADIIIKTMVLMRADISEELLDVLKKQQKMAYFNELIKPRTLNKDMRLSIVENIRWPVLSKYKSLDDIILLDMIEFAEQFTQELYVQALMQGNLTEESAHNVMNSVMTTLNCQPIKETKYVENRAVQLPLGAHFIRCQALNDNDINTVVCNFYQIGPCSTRIESILALLMIFVNEPLYDHLHTKEQLGYHVSTSVRINYGIAGYSITVHSHESKVAAGHVEERIEVFRSKMLQILDEMTNEEFDHGRESLIKINQVVDMSLIEEVMRNWAEITSEDYLFDRRDKEIDVLRTLTKQEVIDFCLDNERSNFRKLSVQVIGNKPAEAATSIQTGKNGKLCGLESDMVQEAELFNELESKLNRVFMPTDGDATAIVDIADFKANLHVFPITKTSSIRPS